MSRKHFRALLILSMLLNIGVMVVRIATENSLPLEVQDYIYERVTGTEWAYIFFFDSGFVLFNIIASIGLLFFKR